MKNNEMYGNSTVFALDIGTRSVVGLLGTCQQDRLVIQHSAIEFHQTRAMFDGQIHDIDGVVKIAKKIKQQLEEKSGLQLTEVAIAAAGRALRTCRVEVERDIDDTKIIDKHIINSIEIEGLQMAQMQLEAETTEINNYYCVGHTIVNYYLNDGLITNPIGHKGKRLKIDILTTFLPYLVVESLYRVMEKVGLNVSFMTLEPIAAIEVAVPQNVRLLNIAMVDIGAGTSDIAITKDGTIIAYGMTSTAGDEITEAIAKTYLLDFDSAEKLKINLGKEEIQKFTDIVGISHEIKTEDILDRIQDSIVTVAKDIATAIIRKNDKAPSVVFLIGGGSQIPRLPIVLAELLDIPKERVVVRGTDIVQNLDASDLIVTGPDGITPIGILAKAIANRAADFIEIYVNQQRVKLFQTKKLKVSDALATIGFNPRDLIPTRGKSINLSINGVTRTLHGEYGDVAKIFLNNEIASLDEAIKNDDRIKIIPGKAGKDAKARISDLVNLKSIIQVNGKPIRKIISLTVNNEVVDEWTLLKDGDHISYKEISTVLDLHEFLSIDVSSKAIFVNGTEGGLQEDIPVGAKIEIKNKESYTKSPDIIEVICNGETIQMIKGNKEIMFIDIFNYIDFDRNRVQGKLVLKHNGATANYTDPLSNGDEIIVKWQQ